MKKVYFNKEFKNISWIIGGRILQMIIALFVNLLTARYLGPSNYGLVNYGAAYVAFFSSLCTLGINSVIIKEFSDFTNEQGEALGTAIILRIISSILSSIMIMCIVSIIDRGERITIIVVMLCSVSLIFQSFDIINYWFQFKYQSKTTSVASLLAYVVVAIYKVLLLILQKDVWWFAFATSIDYIFVAFFLFSAYKRHNGPLLKFSIVKAKTILNKSYHYILSGMMVAIYGQTDKFMLKQMMSEIDVGYYSVATAICAMWVFVLQAIIDSMFPTIVSLYRGDKERYKKKNRQLYAIVFYVSMFVSVFFTILGKYFILLLYGNSYMEAVMPLKIVTWYTAFAYLGVARNAWIVCENKQKYLKYLYFSAAVLNIILNFIFIPLLGTSGAALASLLTNIATSIFLPMGIKDLRANTILMLEAITFKDLRIRKGRQKN